MTEKEACLRWCPFAASRVVVTPAAGMDRGVVTVMHRDPAAIEVDTRCLGSNCMAWRWVKPGDGYCGLAGKP